MALAKNQNKRADIKIVIIGDAYVGKTTFIRRYMERTFSENTGTVGACFFLTKWNDYNIAIWDTAGEERFSGLSSFYCRDASAAIIAYDITNPRSFELLSERYLPLLDAAKEDCLLCVTGMKRDITDDGKRSFVDSCVASNFAMQLNADRFKNTTIGADFQIPFFETSSLTGENVDRVFEYIFSTLLPHASRKGKAGLVHVEGDANSAGKKSCCK